MVDSENYIYLGYTTKYLDFSFHMICYCSIAYALFILLFIKAALLSHVCRIYCMSYEIPPFLSL